MTEQQAAQVAAVQAWQSDPETLRALCALADIDTLLAAGYITQSLASRARRVISRTE